MGKERIYCYNVRTEADYDGTDYYCGICGNAGFYIITRKIFPKGSKKMAALVCALLTAALVGLMFYLLATTPQSL